MMSWCRQCFSDVEVLDGGKRMSCRACGAEHEWAGTHWRRTKEGRGRAAAIAVVAPPAATRTASGAVKARAVDVRLCASYGDVLAPTGRFLTVHVSNTTPEDPGSLLICLAKILRTLQPGTREDLLAQWEAAGGLQLNLEPTLAAGEGRPALAMAVPFGSEIWVTPAVASGSAEALRILSHEVMHSIGVGENLQGRSDTYEKLVDATADFVLETAARNGRLL